MSLFERLHRRALDAGYPRPPWEALDPSGLGGDELAGLRAGWEARAAAEYRSMVVFGELIARFPEAGLPLEVSGAAARLVEDEARHTELCLQVAGRLGGAPSLAVPAAELRLVHDGLPAHLFVARWTVSMFCVGEAASVGLLRALAAQVTDPCIAVVTRTLLRDEELHDRFGWALAGLVVPRLTGGEREWLEHDLRGALAHYERTCAPPGGDEPSGGATAALGALPRASAARAFHARIDEVILPGLAALGLDARRAWALRHAGQAP